MLLFIFLNNKRQMLADIEERYDFRVHIRTDDDLKSSEFRLDIIKQRKGNKNSAKDSSDDKAENVESKDESNPDDKPKKSRRRGRRGGRRHNKKINAEETSDNKEDQGKAVETDSDKQASKKPARKKPA